MSVQPDPWPGFVAAEACWSHHRNEPLTTHTYIVCGECGHVYSRFGLWRAWVRTGRELSRSRIMDPRFGDPPTFYRLHDWRRVWFTRPSRIFFCQECVHDF